MSVGVFGGPGLISASAQSITTLLGFPERKSFSELAIRADQANVGIIWHGPSTVTTVANQRGFIRAGEAFELSFPSAWLWTDDIYLIGTNGDKIYITGLQ